MSFDFSQLPNWRLTPISPSSVPHAIHSSLSCDADFAVKFGKFFSKSAVSILRGPRPPPAGGAAAGCGLARGHITNAPLNDPTYPNLSMLLRPVYNDSA